MHYPRNKGLKVHLKKDIGIEGTLYERWGIKGTLKKEKIRLTDTLKRNKIGLKRKK